MTNARFFGTQNTAVHSLVDIDAACSGYVIIAATATMSSFTPSLPPPSLEGHCSTWATWGHVSSRASSPERHCRDRREAAEAPLERQLWRAARVRRTPLGESSRGSEGGTDLGGVERRAV
jgi:hypothetical protein